MDKMTIRLLGGVEICGSCNAGPKIVSKKAKALVAYLALQFGRPQSREKLAAMFWQNSPEEKARTNLRQVLSSIRTALNGDHGNYLVTIQRLLSFLLSQTTFAGPGGARVEEEAEAKP